MKNQSKHTPWKILTNEQELHNLQTGKTMTVPRYHIQSETHAICTTAATASKQDANLIAAAPEMLECLESALKLLALAECNGAFKDCALPRIGEITIEKINSVISKARGEK